MRGYRLGLALAAIAILDANPLGAQVDAPARQSLTISVLTMGPGVQVWERFGHNAIRVTDAETGSDVAYNYGMFSFADPGFLTRFIQGRMRYWMEGHPADREIASYMRANRSVWTQELELTDAEKVALRDFLEWNAREENKYYSYDYYRDNCSTRVRDALDRSLRGAIHAHTAGVAAGTTYRFHTRRLTESDPFIYTGIEIGLGPAADRPISRWDEMFLPLSLREQLRGVTIRASDGSVRPLVRSEETLYTSTATDPPSVPRRKWTCFLAAGTLLGALLVLWGERLGESRGARTGYALVGGVWCLVAGIAGAVLAYLWGFTDHAVTYGNENLLQLSPFSLPLAALVPAMARRRRAGPWATRLGVAVAILALIGVAWKLLPLPTQANGEIIALTLPLQLGIGISAWRLARSRPPEA